ncbi:MAG TPA: adenosylcobinamide amidohydrolase [Chlorobaculum parvum]|uniref:Adenosylcobinamide amidohydrolase n=1 Tax=Chlorobaculum parvum TaxID=274539 RepID=A0A7C5HE15_9CHLB|nr:adenosylcobinamide amidohydrolase [Chlorobaculum parvum]
MKLGVFGDAEVHRDGKMISVRFLAPHRVVSTCRVHGGLRDDLDGVFNHQSCEPAGHRRKDLKSIVAEPERYHQGLCERYGVAELSASLGTAANMNHAAIATRSFRDLSVTVICTGGVEGNAGRAGDPASVWEGEEGFEPLDKKGEEPPGTINMILLINRELSHGAMVRSIVTATEAKSAVLQELAVSSRYSEGLATGTGTDQIAVVCALGGSRPLTSTGKHSKLGELIAQAVIDALRDTLSRQNSLTPQSQRSVWEHIRRFGAKREEVMEMVAGQLSPDGSEVFRKNFEGLDRDSMTVAAACALVHLYDKHAWGLLPDSCMGEIFVMQAALFAAAVSHRQERIATYAEQLEAVSWSTGREGLLSLITTAWALGYADKWND